MVFLISLLSLACVNAEDLDVADSNQGDSQLLEISEESSDVASASSGVLSTSETELEISKEANVSTPASSEAPSTGEAESDSQSQSYLILDNDTDIEKEDNDINSVSIDCSRLEYVSSAGLRILLFMHNDCDGGVVMESCKESVIEVLSGTDIDILD